LDDFIDVTSTRANGKQRKQQTFHDLTVKNDGIFNQVVALLMGFLTTNMVIYQTE